jgi:uncharacterized protein YndB with AHSA1/START domain
METDISPYHVRRSTWIAASASVIWEEFTSFERMRCWYGTGHTLTEYEPRVGGTVETAVDIEGTEHRFRGEVITFEPGVEITFEQRWLGSDWEGPSLVTIRLSPLDGGTLVELFHHGYERLGGHPSGYLDGFESGWTTRQVHALRDLVPA